MPTTLVEKLGTPGDTFLDLPVHPAANAFPMMDDDELQELVDDIKKNGLTDPITLLDGAILDGRNRYAATRLSGVSPMFLRLSAKDVESPVTYVLSKNLLRRHLSAGQRAALAYEIEPLFAEEAKMRALAGSSKGGQVTAAKRQGAPPPAFSNETRDVAPQKASSSPSAATPTLADTARETKKEAVTFTDRDAGRARTQAAKTAKASTGYTAQFKRLVEEAPAVAKKVKQGKITIPQANRQVFPDMTPIKDRETKKPAAKRTVTKSKTGKVESSRVTLRLTVTFGSIAGAQAVMQILDDDPRLLVMEHEVVEDAKISPAKK